MEISYKKDGNQNTMIVKGVHINEEDYKLQMVINNKIPGLVPLRLETINNEIAVYYETTSKIAMSNMFARRQMSGKEIYSFIKDIKILSDNMKEYLLDIGDIILDFESIFFNRRNGKYEFCYLPYNEGALHENIRNMFDKMLEYINHNDREAVLIAYGIQHITLNDDFTITDIMDCAYKNIQEYKKQRQIKDNGKGKEFEKDVKTESEQKSSGQREKKSILHTLISIFKKKSLYLNEGELYEKAELICEDKENCYNDAGTKNNTFNKEVYSNCFSENEEDDRTMILTSKGMLKGIMLRALDTEEQITILPNKFPYIIGKSELSCDFAVSSSVVSRVHLRIIEEKDGFFVEDLNSTNGTLLNGNLLMPHNPQMIKVGDKITLANIEFIVE